MLRSLDILESKQISYDKVLYFGYVGDYTNIDSIKLPLSTYCTIITSCSYGHVNKKENAMMPVICFSGYTDRLCDFVNRTFWCDVFSMAINDSNYNNINRPLNYNKSYVNTELGLYVDGYNENTVNLHVVPDDFYINGGDITTFYDNTIKVIICDIANILQRKKSSKFLRKIYNFLYNLVQKLTYFNYLPSNI